MESILQAEQAWTTQRSGVQPSNDNGAWPLSIGRSVFPEDAVAHIYQPSRSVTSSGRARSRGWRLVFERRSAPFIEPLMGYTGSADPLLQVKLSFPTLEAATRYARRQGLTYVVRAPSGQGGERPAGRDETERRAFSEATLDRLGLAALQDSYRHALDGAANRNDPSGPEGWATPMDVVKDAGLALEEKRAILMNWVWTEYLIDQATNEGMPENSRPSRLHEAEQALLALEREVAAGRAGAGTRKAA